MLKFENAKPWRFRANNLSGFELYTGTRKPHWKDAREVTSRILVLQLLDTSITWLASVNQVVTWKGLSNPVLRLATYVL